MTKKEAIRLFGRTQVELAAGLGVTKQAVSAWPDELPEAVADRVRGAALRLGLLHPESRVAHYVLKPVYEKPGAAVPHTSSSSV